MKNKSLLVSITKKDLEVQTFRSGGKGGQHQNTTDSGVRIIHHESGAVGESREERSQRQNKKIALKRLTNHIKFKIWINRKLLKLDELERHLNDILDKDLHEDNLKIEIRTDHGWEVMK